MIRVLYIARYHHPMMERKIALLANQRDLNLWLVRPNAWQDEFGRTTIPDAIGNYRTIPVRLLGPSTEWHRTLYCTLAFGMLEARPDLIHAEEEPDSLAALQIALARRIFAPRAQLVLHTWQNVNRVKRWYVRLVIRATTSQADAILCANQEAVAVLRQLGYRRQAEVIPHHGVDLRVFHPFPRQVEQSHELKVIYAGRFAPEKGLDTLLQAISQLRPAARLILIGDGPAYADLTGRVVSLGIDDCVQFLSPMPPEKLAQELSQADALVLPSRTTGVWKEQFGRILIQAMACRVPVVGSDSGAIPEVVGDAGLLFAEGNVEQLTACLRRLIESPALRQDLMDRGEARVAEFYTQERIAAQTADFYRRRVSNPGQGQ